MLNTLAIENLFSEKIIKQQSLGAGGSFATAGTLTLESGKELFFKQKDHASQMFIEEKKGLERLAIPESIRIPNPFFADEYCLVLELLKSSPSGRDQDQNLARGLGNIHKNVKAKNFGLPTNNFIGATEQINTQDSSWANFFINHRLCFQFELAKSKGLIDQVFEEDFNRLVENVAPKILNEVVEEPSLLHGDLWSGNIMATDTGPALIDPAVYYGHREADLGMTMLFGGFSQSFYQAYDQEYPLKKGWQRRANFYNIYHLLNHMNLMGSGYTGQTWRLIKTFL